MKFSQKVTLFLYELETLKEVFNVVRARKLQTKRKTSGQANRSSPQSVRAVTQSIVG